MATQHPVKRKVRHSREETEQTVLLSVSLYNGMILCQKFYFIDRYDVVCSQFGSNLFFK